MDAFHDSARGYRISTILIWRLPRWMLCFSLLFACWVLSFFLSFVLSFFLSFFRSFVLSFFRSFFPVSSFLSDLIFLLLAVYFVGSETKPINQRVQRNATRENEEEKTMRRGGRIDQSEIKPLYQSRKTDERNARMVTDMAGYQITYVEVRVTLVLCNCLPNTS